MHFYKLESGTVINLSLVTAFTQTHVYFESEEGWRITPDDHEELCALVGAL